MTDFSPISQALLDEIANKDAELSTIIRYLSDGADINSQSDEDGYTPLMLAVDIDDEILVDYLLKHGANPLLKNHYQEKASGLALRYSGIDQLLREAELAFKK